MAGENEVLDLTVNPDDVGDIDEGKFGQINLRELQERGTVIEDDLNDTFTDNLNAAEWTERDFFAKAKGDDPEARSNALNSMLAVSRINESDDEEDGESLTSFVKKAEKMTDLTPDGGVKKKIKAFGAESEGPVPPHGTVTIHYSCYLEDEPEPYDSTRLRNKAEKFRVDDGKLLPGMEIAVKSMAKRERAEFLISPDYAFGPKGCPPRIPENAKILVDIEMLSYAAAGEAEALLALDPEERKKMKSYDEIEKVVGEEHKEANKQFHAKEYRGALRRYERCLRLLEDAELKDDDQQIRQTRLLLKMYLNKAQTCINLGMPKRACTAAARALEIEPKNPKALYKMARAKRKLNNLSDARRYLIQAQRAIPTDVDIGRELKSLEIEIARQTEDEKRMYRQMMGNYSSVSESNGDRSLDINISDLRIDDEKYSELQEQMEGFRDDEGEEMLPLPMTLSKVEVNAIKKIAREMGFFVGSRTMNGLRQTVISKKADEDR